MKNGRLADDKDGKTLQLFFPRGGVSITSPYTPTEDLMISPTEDITMTLDGVTKDYFAYDVFGLTKGITYTFSAGFNAHRM